ncbi:MAG TPA: hypothetical protein VME66_16680 [Candidatus Acidoferrales bacterium]|nr:hypothetical protein [Candidatus Acidoferrales bacterium]
MTNNRGISTPQNLLDLILDDWRAVRKFTTASWSARRQREMLAAYRFLVGKIDAAIIDSKERGAGDEANLWRAGQTLLKSVASELRMWILLKESDSDSAWNAYCDAEQYALNARRWLPDDFEPAKDQVGHLALVETIAFPEQPYFFSSGLIVGLEVCTVCESEYGSCEHLVGELYCGEMCARRCEEIKECLEVSLVKQPADKRCRIKDAGGVDPLTGDTPRGAAKAPPKEAKAQEAAETEGTIA